MVLENAFPSKYGLWEPVLSEEAQGEESLLHVQAVEASLAHSIHSASRVFTPGEASTWEQSGSNTLD